MVEGIPIQESKKTREDRAEILLRFLKSAKNIEGFNGRTLEEAFRSEETIRELINNLSFENFAELLNGTNGILRNKEKEEWSIDGKNVSLSSWWFGENAPPHYKDKLDLLRKVLISAKKMNESARSLEDIGILFGVGVNEIHPFNDANGRTGRLMYTLLSYGIHKDKIKEVLGEEGRDVVDFDVQYIESVVQDILWEKIVQEEDESYFGLLCTEVPREKFNKDISETLKNSFSEFLGKNSGSEVLDLAIYEWAKAKKLEKIFTKAPEAERVRIPVELLLPELREADMRQVENGFWELKKETAELLIDSIINPDKPEYIKNNRNIPGSILSHIKRWIITHYAKSNRGKGKKLIILDSQF